MSKAWISAAMVLGAIVCGAGAAEPPVTIGGTAIVCKKGDVGVGAKPGEMGVVLIGASADPTFHKKGEKSISREGARTDADFAKLPGYVEVAGTGDLITSMEMRDCRLHVEWYSPPGGEGQQAGNSGVYVQGLYEVQILGTFSADKLGRPEKDDEAGAIYKVKTPDVNASTGPGTWQAYDIWFQAPRIENGKKTADARMTVYWNGALVHNDVAVHGPTGDVAGSPEPGIGPLKLQDHDTKAEGSVRFRNVWVSPLREVKYVAAGDWEKPLEKAGADGLPEGWAPRGGKAEFRVEKGVVVGSSRPHTGNTFLVSAKEYADFEMEVDYEDDPNLNSGVQIRSSVRGGYDKRDGVVFGPQVEIDPSDRAYSAGMYDEQRRGWLITLMDAPAARAAYRKTGTNHLRVLAEGPVIRMWLNGVAASSVFDAMDERGRFGLQVHDVGEEKTPREVRFWNMRVREMKRVE